MFPGEITRVHAMRSRRRSLICPACGLSIGLRTRLVIPTAGFTFGKASKRCSVTLNRICLARWLIIPHSKMYPRWILRFLRDRPRSLEERVDRFNIESTDGKKPKKPQWPRCKYCGCTEPPVFVRAHMECPKCHTITESCYGGVRCG